MQVKVNVVAVFALPYMRIEIAHAECKMKERHWSRGASDALYKQLIASHPLIQWRGSDETLLPFNHGLLRNAIDRLKTLTSICLIVDTVCHTFTNTCVI
jgi:hypothetical protein